VSRGRWGLWRESGGIARLRNGAPLARPLLSVGRLRCQEGKGVSRNRKDQAKSVAHVHTISRSQIEPTGSSLRLMNV
jgi:hypothetical protein